jgi:hypothetical protein
MRGRVSPSKQKSIESGLSPLYSIHQEGSIYEEEKNEMMIDTSTNPLAEL